MAYVEGKNVSYIPENIVPNIRKWYTDVNQGRPEDGHTNLKHVLKQ
jgi:hypothetical protein